ncbi:MAG: MG2 domain-containing protein [Candidatus Sumerlaeia bacterium]
MKRGVISVAAMLLLVLVLGSCTQGAGHEESLSVTGVVPPPGEKINGRLTVVFNQPIRQDGATTSPLVFTPPIAGEYEVGPNYINFKQSEPVTARLIECRVHESIRPARATASVAATTFTLTNFNFEADAFWPLDRATTSTVYGLQFTAPVKAEAVGDRLALALPDGRAVGFKVFPGNQASTVRVLTEPTTAPVTLTVAAGVPEEKGRFVTRHESVFKVEPERKKGVEPLKVYYASWENVERDRQRLYLYFSKNVTADAIAARLALTDVSTTVTRRLPFKVARAEDHQVTIELAAPDPTDIKVHLELPAGTEAEDKTTLPAPWKTDLAHRIQLEHEYSNWDNDDKGLALRLSYNQALKLDEVKTRLTIRPTVANMTIDQDSSNQISIRGDFATNTPYQVVLAPGITFAGWVKLKTALPVVVTSPEKLPTYLGFSDSERYYFPRRFGNAVPVKTRGIKEVSARLYKMFPNNIAVGISDLAQNDTLDMLDWSEQVGQARIAIAGRMNQLITTPVRMDVLTTAPVKGVYVLAVGAEGNEIRRIVLMTDMGALAHWQGSEAAVFVHNLFTLAPVASARVQVYSKKNQLLGETRTDAQGIARLGGFGATRGNPAVAVISSGKDYTFVALDRREETPPAMSAVQLSYNAKAYDGFVYADRDLYRPGETVHLRWIVRKNYGDALTSAPLVLNITAPNGRTALKKTVALSSLGTAGLDFATLDSYATGRYSASLTVPGSENAIGSYGFQLEEFVPLRMKTEVTPPAAPWVETGGEYTMQVRGRHLTGLPAQDRTAQARISFRSGYEFKDWPGYEFGNDVVKQIDTLELGEETTDADGVATFRFKAPSAAEATEPLIAHIVGYVYELGGRAVRGSVDTAYFPSPICLGVKVGGDDANDAVINVAAVAPDGKPADLDKVQVTLERETYDYYVRRLYSHYQPSWSNRFEKVQSDDVTLSNGLGRLSLNLKHYGFYRVRVSSPKTRQFSTISFYAWGGKPQVERENEPSLIKLKLDKESVEIGRSARLRIESPFDGKGVIVVQGEHINRLMPVDVRGGSTVVDVPVEAAWAPNVWLEVTVIHAVEKGRKQVYPFSSFAAVPLLVRDPARRIDVALGGLPKEILPGSPLPVAIRTVDSRGKPIPAEVTLAAVDEGIHMLTGYKTPDPVGWFGRLRSPDFNRAHYYDKIASEFNAPKAGGDGAGPERLGRPARTWIRTVALWTGRVTTGADGAASVTLAIPAYFSGQLRLVAVAADPRAAGAREERLFVRRPWMLQTSLPRFMLPGDEAQALATVYNTTDATGTVRVSFETSGTLMQGHRAKGEGPIVVGPKSEATVTRNLVAGKAVGQGELVWKAEVIGRDGRVTETLVEQAYLPVTEPAAWQTRRTLAVVAPGKSATFDTAGFMQDDWTRLSVTVGADPLIRLEKALQSVVGYPYGCVEQTTSKLMSLYLLRKNSALIGDLDPKMGMLDAYIRGGIDRLLSMQTGSGGLAYWPGQYEPYPYGSVYGLHFLTLVRNGREFPVDADNYEILRRYVRRLVTEKRSDSNSDYYLRAYATYVLALSGDPEAPALTEWFRLLQMPESGRWLLAAAVAISTNDMDRVKLYMHAARTAPYLEREQDDTLNSPIRNEAVELLSLVHMKGDRARMHKRAEDLTQWLQTERWGTTQENAFVIAALCQYLDQVTSGVEQARGRIEFGGRQAAIAGRDVFRKKLTGPGAGCKVTNDGLHDLYVTAAAAGIPSDAQTSPVTQGMSIGRRILDSKGETVDPGALTHGGSYVVELAIGCERNVKNVVVTDLLPAGFEIDNPRLNQSERTGIVLPHDSVQPTHLEIRDERLVLVFNSLGATSGDDRHYYYYLVNAVTPGRFQRPPVVAEAMYDPAVRGSSSQEEIVVKK